MTTPGGIPYSLGDEDYWWIPPLMVPFQLLVGKYILTDSLLGKGGASALGKGGYFTTLTFVIVLVLFSIDDVGTAIGMQLGCNWSTI